MATIPAGTMERLAFVRYAHQQGVVQSRTAEPGNSIGVLLFHDAVDLFLQLAAEHLNITKKLGKAFLLDYLAEIDAHLQPTTLSGRPGMVRLNAIRNSLKHNGVRPSPIDVEGLRGSVTSFLEDNTPIVFGLQFYEISMARLVSVEKARDQLLEAERLLSTGDHVAAIEACAIAFHYVVRNYHKLNPPAFKKATVGPKAGSGAGADVHQLLTVDDAHLCYSTVVGAALAFQRRFAV